MNRVELQVQSPFSRASGFYLRGLGPTVCILCQQRCPNHTI